MALSIEEKYDEVRQLTTMGKEKGYLLYEEVNDLLPSEISSSDELDDIFSMFGSMGIEVVDSEQKFREKAEEGGAGRAGRRASREIGVRDAVVFNEEEVTEEKLEAKIKETLKLIGKANQAHSDYLGYRKHFVKLEKK